MVRPMLIRRRALTVLVGAWAGLSAAGVSAGVVNCWKSITKNCCEILAGGMTPNLARKCGEVLCPDTIVSNPPVGHTVFGEWDGTDDSEPTEPECLCKWRWRYCNANDECITTDTFYPNWGTPSKTTGNPCTHQQQ